MKPKTEVRENRYVKITRAGDVLTVENRAMPGGCLLYWRAVCRGKTLSEERLPLPAAGESVSVPVKMPEVFPEGRCYGNLVGKSSEGAFQEQFLLSDLPLAEEVPIAFPHRTAMEEDSVSIHAKDFSCRIQNGGIASLKSKKELVKTGEAVTVCLLSETGETAEETVTKKAEDGDRGVTVFCKNDNISFQISFGKGGLMRICAESLCEKAPAVFFPLAEEFDALAWDGLGLFDGEEQTVGNYRMTLADLQSREGESGIRREIRALAFGDRSGYPFSVSSPADMIFSVQEDGVLLTCGEGKKLELTVKGGKKDEF